jgi:hypothetical protein
MEVTVKNRADELKVSESVHSFCIGPRDNQVISVPTEAKQVTYYLIVSPRLHLSPTRSGS